MGAASSILIDPEKVYSMGWISLESNKALSKNNLYNKETASFLKKLGFSSRICIRG
jgi:hypothetical protein